jgi:hypothetical protein
LRAKVSRGNGLNLRMFFSLQTRPSPDYEVAIFNPYTKLWELKKATVSLTSFRMFE